MSEKWIKIREILEEIAAPSHAPMLLDTATDDILTIKDDPMSQKDYSKMEARI